MSIVKKLLIASLKHYYEKYMRHRRSDVYYVHEIVGCYTKATIQKQLQEVKIITLESLSDRIIIGEAVHEGLSNIMKHVVDTEPEEMCKEVKVNDHTVTVCGTCDLLIDDSVVEIKYVSKISKIVHKEGDKTRIVPLQHHEMQARLYGWLYDVSNVVLLYVTPMKIFEINLRPYSDDEAIKIVSDWVNLKPSPRWDWECGLCPVKKLCPLQ